MAERHVTISTVAPTTPSVGDGWIHPTTRKEKLWDGTTWQDITREETYTSWAIQPIYNTGQPYDVGHDFVGIRNDGRVIWHDNSAHITYIISPAGELEATLIYEE